MFLSTSSLWVTRNHKMSLQTVVIIVFRFIIQGILRFARHLLVMIPLQIRWSFQFRFGLRFLDIFVRSSRSLKFAIMINYLQHITLINVKFPSFPKNWWYICLSNLSHFDRWNFFENPHMNNKSFQLILIERLHKKLYLLCLFWVQLFAFRDFSSFSPRREK